MKRIAIALSAIAAFALTADLAMAVSNGAAFDPLRDELVHRTENDFTGKLTKAQKKQSRTVKKSIKLIDKRSTSVKKDAAIGKKVAKLLEKAFSDEFVDQPSKLADVGPLVDQAAAGLAEQVRIEVQEAIGNLELVEEKRVPKIRKFIDRANGALDAAGASTNRKKLFSQIGKAGKFAAKATKLVAKFGDVTEPEGDFVTADVNGLGFSSDFAQAEYSTGDQTLQIFANRTLGDGTVETLILVVRGVDGPGTFLLTAQDAQASFEVGNFPTPATKWELTPETGFIEVTTLDVPGQRVALSFTFEAEHATEEPVVITEGEAEIDAMDVRDGNGF